MRNSEMLMTYSGLCTFLGMMFYLFREQVQVLLPGYGVQGDGVVKPRVF